jgi:hypothetical protein
MKIKEEQQTEELCKKIGALEHVKKEAFEEIVKRKSLKYHAKLVGKYVWVGLMITLWSVYISKQDVPYSKIAIVMSILFVKDKVTDILNIHKNRKKMIESDTLLKELGVSDKN